MGYSLFPTFHRTWPVNHSDTALPPQHYKAVGGRRANVFEEMTAAKIGLALPLQSIFVVKMRVIAGDCFAPTQLDR